MMLLLIILLGIASASACQGPQNPDELMCCMVAEDPMSPEFRWESIPSLLLENHQISDNTLLFRSCWNTDSLYFRFDVSDQDLRAYQLVKDHRELYLDDMVEFLLDTNLDATDMWLDDDIIYHFNILGQKKDDRGTPEGNSDTSWDGVARYIVAVDGTINDSDDMDNGYSVTVAVPWTEIGRSPEPGLRMGLNFAMGDNDGKGREIVQWRPCKKMRTPSMFGVLVLTYLK